MNWWDDVDWLDPINKDYQLNDGIIGWWMGVPTLFGGKRLWDLNNHSHASITSIDTTSHWINTEHGPSLDFNSTNGQVIANITLGTEFSIECLVFDRGTGSSIGRIVSTDDFIELNKFSTSLQFAKGGSFNTTISISNNTWYHVVANFKSGSQGSLTVSNVNGTRTTNTFIGTYTPTSTTVEFGNQLTLTRNWGGPIQYVIIRNRTVDANQAFENWKSGFDQSFNRYSAINPFLLKHRDHYIFRSLLAPWIGGAVVPGSQSYTINKNLQIIWDSLRLATQNIVVDYNCRTLSDKNSNLVWNVRNSTLSEKLLQYHILSKVSQDFDISYDILVGVVQDIGFLFNTFGIVNGPLSISWNDLSLLSKQNDISYNILNKINTTIDTIANVRQLTKSEKQVLWNVLFNLASNTDFTWDTLQSSRNSKEMLYNIRKIVESNIQSLFNTRQLSSSDIDYVWNVIGPQSARIIFEMMMYIQQQDSRNFYIKKQELHDLIINTVNSMNMTTSTK